MRSGSVLLLTEDRAPAAVVDDEVSRTRQLQCDCDRDASRNLSTGLKQWLHLK